jgi:hypothetical protein
MHPHHLQPFLSFYNAIAIKIIRVANSVQPVNYNVYLIVTIGDRYNYKTL